LARDNGEENVMDIALFATLVGSLYPPLKDAVDYVSKRRGSFTPNYQEQLKKMVTYTQDDLSRLKGELEDLRKVCAEINLPLGERGSVPWHVPHDVNIYLTWRYRRTSRKIENLCADFKTSMDGIIDAISCCAGIMEGRENMEGPYTEPDWARNLGRHHEDLRDKLKSPSHYSIDELTNAMEQFLDQCRFTMQQLSDAI
jgi:hypothetical protein